MKAKNSVEISQSPKPTFSGHDSFECRQFWLKKGFDHLMVEAKFNDEAVVPLGVGRNMVNAIRHWMKSFGMIDQHDKLTDFSRIIFGKKGFDPYLEDESSLWLLHFQLVTTEFASLYGLIFNEFRKQKPEFTKEHIVRFILTKYPGFNENTIGKDFETFTRMYIPKSNEAEENYDGILSELNLVEEIKKNIYVIKNEDRQRIPAEIILYCILQQSNKKSFDFESLLLDKNSVGSVFALTKQGLADKLEELGENYKREGIVFSNHAGIRELQFKKTLPSPKEFLTNYYNQTYAG
ncbi:MAG TPA: DUF4007 family protein [Bacteroidia bacterium]|nr:DUF4007 family protein [Bacteroidia bacterium]